MTPAETTAALLAPVTADHAERLILAAIQAGETDYQAAEHAVNFIQRLYGSPLPVEMKARAWAVYLEGAALIRASIAERTVGKILAQARGERPS